MKIRLNNGLTIEGSQEQVAATLKKLGYALELEGMFYNSESKGPILISEMATVHLKNAILKMYVEWVNGLRSINEPSVLIDEIAGGIRNKTWLAMVREYRTREE